MLGNGGYDARHYALRLSYVPSTHRLSGTVTMTRPRRCRTCRASTSTCPACRCPPSASTGPSHVVAGRCRSCRITPPHGIGTGTTFTTAVTYAGSPKTILHSPIVFGSPYGWIYTPDGAFVGDEPNAAHTWFPVNDYPTRQGVLHLHDHRPGRHAGRSQRRAGPSHVCGGHSTFVWNETQPMASYLASIDIGKWTFRSGTHAARHPRVHGLSTRALRATHKARTCSG